MRCPPELRDQLRAAKEWSVSTELLAQLIEEVSILAAERRRKQPREVPRPAHLRKRARQPHGVGIKHAVGVLKANAQGRVYRGSSQ